MRPEEEHLAAAVEQLKTFSATVTDKAALADLAIVITGFQTMRPYVSVGLKVCPSEETLQAINRLQGRGVVAQQLWHTLMNAVELARKRNPAPPLQQAARKPCRRAAPHSLRGSLGLGFNRLNRPA